MRAQSSQDEPEFVSFNTVPGTSLGTCGQARRHSTGSGSRGRRGLRGQPRNLLQRRLRVSRPNSAGRLHLPSSASRAAPRARQCRRGRRASEDQRPGRGQRPGAHPEGPTRGNHVPGVSPGSRGSSAARSPLPANDHHAAGRGGRHGWAGDAAPRALGPGAGGAPSRALRGGRVPRPLAARADREGGEAARSRRGRGLRVAGRRHPETPRSPTLVGRGRTRTSAGARRGWGKWEAHAPVTRSIHRVSGGGAARMARAVALKRPGETVRECPLR